MMGHDSLLIRKKRNNQATPHPSTLTSTLRNSQFPSNFKTNIYEEILQKTASCTHQSIFVFSRCTLMSSRAEGLVAVEARHSRRTLPGRGGGGGRSSATPSRWSRASGCLAASGGGGVLVVARPTALWLGRGGAGAARHQAPRQPAPSSPRPRRLPCYPSPRAAAHGSWHRVGLGPWGGRHGPP